MASSIMEKVSASLADVWEAMSFSQRQYYIDLFRKIHPNCNCGNFDRLSEKQFVDVCSALPEFQVVFRGQIQ